MTESVTLELADDVVRQAKETARRTGRQMGEVLADWIRQGAANEDTTEIMPGITYPIYTPLGNEEVVQMLLDALHATDTPERGDRGQ